MRCGLWVVGHQMSLWRRGRSAEISHWNPQAQKLLGERHLVLLTTVHSLAMRTMYYFWTFSHTDTSYRTQPAKCEFSLLECLLEFSSTLLVSIFFLVFKHMPHLWPVYLQKSGGNAIILSTSAYIRRSIWDICLATIMSFHMHDPSQYSCPQWNLVEGLPPTSRMFYQE